MKKFFTILMMICFGFTGLLLGCGGGRYDNLTISIKTEQARAEDGSITLYVGEGTEDITVSMAGAPKGFNFVPSFSLSENIVKLGDVNHMLDNGVRKTIEGIAPGFTVLTAYTSEGSKTATLKINVIKKAESISYNTDYKIAVLNTAGHRTVIDTASAISIFPKDSNQNTIKYSLATPGLSDVVSIRGNELIALAGIETTPLTEFTVKAEVVNHLGEVNENVDPVYIPVRIMDNILPDDIKLYQSKTEYDSVSDAVLNNPINSTLILSKNYHENNATYVFVGVNTTENITVIPPANVSSSPVMTTLAGKPTRAGVKYFVYRVQAIRYSDVKSLTFTITVDGYENFFNFTTKLDVKCELYIRNFSVNDETLIDGESHEVTLYTNDQTSGTMIKIAVGNPKEILAADAKFFIQLYNHSTGEVVSSSDLSKFFIVTNLANNSHGLVEEGYLKEVNLALKLNGTTLSTADSGKYKLVITAEQPLAFTYKATTEVFIRIVQGISSMDSISYEGVENSVSDPIKINFEEGVEPLKVTLNAQPASETSYETLYAESTNEAVFKVVKESNLGNTFLIQPISVGKAEVRFCSKNLTSPLVYKVNVYEDIEDFFISVDEFSQASYIGKSTVVDNSLTSATIKANNVGAWSSNIQLKLSTLPTTAEFYETEVEVYNAAGEAVEKDGIYIQDENFKLNTRNLSFSMKHTTLDMTYKVVVKMINFDGTTIQKEFLVNSYVPITKITMTLTNNTLYNPNNLGYFDLNHTSKTYTKTQTTIATNANATFAYTANIFYEVIVNGTVTENLLIRNGTEFSLNPNYEITKYPQKVYLIAYALEFGKRVETEPAIITIKDPVTVDAMAVEGDINGDILYFKLGYDSFKDIKITLTPSINLFNSGVKWVQYREGTTEVLDFADNNGGQMVPVDTTDAIFSVDDLGNNNFRINAIQAGNARFLLIPEDKIKNINGSHYVYEWDKIIELFVSVADGSRQNPYHVASFKDFKDIEKAMDKFYVLTNDIAIEDNWIPLGYGTRTPLNGGINGLYSRIVNAETGEKYSVQYDITDISYAVALPSNISHYGLVYALGDGIVIEGEEDKDKAILENMIVSYSYVQAEFNGEFTFGGLVAINRGTIDNCRVTLTNVSIQLSGLSYSVGGMVGLNDGGTITNKDVDNAVNVNINIELKADNFLSAYFGGMVGQMKSGLINGYQKDYTEIDTVGITFGDQGYDVISNFRITTDKTYPSEIVSAVGGVVGFIQNTDTTAVDIKDLAVSGTVRASAIDNVGGIVGQVSGALNKEDNSVAVRFFNNTNNAKIFGRKYVGGVVGRAKYASFNYCSAENYRETQTTPRAFITGVDYVGGFGGMLENINISNSYVVSYFENAPDFKAEDISSTNSDIVVNSETATTESRVGGFVASLTLEDTYIVNKVATLLNSYVSSNSTRYCGGVFGYYNGLGGVNNVICKGFAKGFSPVTGQGTMGPISPAATFYSALNPTGMISSLADVVKGSGTYDDTAIWKTEATINDGLPYLLDDAGNILFAFLPITIEVVVKDQDGMDIDEFNNSGYVYVENNVALIYLNELTTGELTAEQLLALNTHKITDFAQLNVLPWTLKTSRLVITSSNSSVVRVSQDSLVAMKEGSARITVSSKLNADYRCEFFVIIKYGLTNYKLYETSNFAPSSEVKDDETDPITMVVDKKVALYENTTYTRNVDGTDYDLKVTNTTAVKFVLENDTYKDSFIINTNWTISHETYTEIAVSTLTTIYSKLITEDVAVKVTATPFLEVSYLNTQTQLFYEHLKATFYVKVVNGADNIYFESSISQTQGIEITQLQSFVFTVIMDTDTNEDAIVPTITDSEGNIIDDTGAYEGSVVRLQTNSGGEANIEEVIDGKRVLVGKKVSYTISYEAETDDDGRVESLKEDKKFVIFFSSLLVPDVKVSLPITVKPQDIVSADIGVYSSTADYNTSASGTTKNGTDKFIFNGGDNVALLTVEIYPDFSRFASFDIVYTSSSGFPISMTQLKYTKDAGENDDPFSDYGEGRGTYVTGYGMKVDKSTGGEPLLGSGSGIYSYSKIYYFSMMVGSEVPDLTTYTMTLVFYDSDKNIIEPRNISYTFQSLASPQIELGVKDKTLNNNLPIGTSNELNVQTKNYTGDIAWEISIDANGVEDGPTGHKCIVCGEKDGELPKQYTTCVACMNENFALLDSLVPTKDENGKYYLNIPSDNFDLLGRFIVIKGIIEKSEGSENFTDEAEIKVYVSLYTVTDMSVDGLSADLLKLQIYTPYSLKVNLSAVYNPDVDYTTHNSSGYTIANMVARLKDEISKAAIWEANEATGADKLIKNSTKLYNSCYSCISYGGYYAVYGEIVDIMSSITATAKVGYSGGVPVYIPIVDPPAEPDPDAEPVIDNTRSKTFSRQFTLTFTYQNDIKNPIPITSAEDFMKMEEGKDYRLSSDIMLTDYTPLTTRILSLDGNGYTIYVASFAEGIATTNLGLFATVAGADGTAEATMIYNLNVHYISNVIETITYPNGEIKYTYTLPEPPEKYPQKTLLDTTAVTEFNFGGIAGINNGIITNCSVTGLISITATDDSLTAAYVGGIAGVNNGFITNSNVTDLDLTSSGSIGGVAGSNTNTISSTYTDELYINNISKNTELFYTGGFVCDNGEGAKVLECYTQGRRNVNDVTIVNTNEGLKTSGTAGGFVYKNEGSIEDCYSNIAITASAFSAGFVFVNEEEAVVNNCYSISRVALNSKAASPFTGIGKDGGVVVTYNGTISNCFYLRDNYNNFGNEPATRITLNDFSTSDVFGTYNIKLNTNDPKVAEGYSWYIAGGKPRLTQTDIKTYSAYDYKGKTKNYTANSEVYFKYNNEDGKWFAYSKAAGMDKTKEMIITRRATLVYYVDGNSDEYYFKPAFDSNDNPMYGTVAGKQVRLYNTIDSARTGKVYFLDESVNKMKGYNTVSGGIDTTDIVDIYYSYIEEVYAEETGISANVWRDIETGKSYYKRTSDTGLYENFTIDAINQDPVMRFVYELEVVSVTYKTPEGTSLVDLSIDSEGECDFTYILTGAEYKEKYGIENIPEPYKTYGGCYSYRSLDSIQYHYGYSYFDENGNRIAPDDENNYPDKTMYVMGTKNNPYLIYDVVSYNTYFKDKFNSELSNINKREYYRVVGDINFDFENISTSSKILFGYLEGNGMTIRNITLTYVSGNQETIGFGLFSQSLFSIVNNLNLEVIEIASSAHTYVGGLVGWARTDVQETTETIDDNGTPIVYTSAQFNGKVIQEYDDIPEYLRKNYFNNIVVFKKDSVELENVGLVLGRNFAGGLVGYMTGRSKANNIDTSVNVNAAYVVSPDIKGRYLAYQNVKTDAEVTALSATNVYGPLTKPDGAGNQVPYTKSDWTYFINRQLSYSGLAFGVVDVEITDEDDDFNESYSVYDILVSGKFSGAGGTIGGVIGLLAKDNIAYNINVKVLEEQTIRGSLYAGGLIGENRGKLIASTIDYEDEKQNNNVALVTNTRINKTFFNNNASTKAIGGLVGFNNGGEITSCVSHIDVRNSIANVAGGAVGRSIMGKYSHVIVSGSVRAKSIMGGFTGTSNTRFAYIGEDGIGVAAQQAIYPNDGSNETTVKAESITITADNYTSCIAANNWQLDDYPFLTEKEAVKRVAGGFIGSEALSPHYYVNMTTHATDPTTGLPNPYTASMQIYSRMNKCFYTNSLYYGSYGKDTNPSFYMPIAYITDFDTVTLYNEKAADGNQVFPYMYPFIATNTIYGKDNTSNAIVGLTHYQIAYGDANMYSTDYITSSATQPIESLASGTDVNITVTLPYEETIEETNLYETTMTRKYLAKTDLIVTTTEGVKSYAYKYQMKSDQLLSGTGPFVYTEKIKPDGVTVQSREFGVIEKYFVYADFVNSQDFDIGENFYGKMEEDNNVYPKVFIKSSSLEWMSWDGSEFNEDENGFYLIENEKELAALAFVVNEDKTDSKTGKKYGDETHKYKLMADLDLSGKYWTPIGTEDFPFKALFDGNGHTIANANMTLDGADFAGLFGYIENATVKNLTVTGGSMVSIYNGSTTYAGGIIGFAGYSTIENCINENSVSGDGFVGGIAGSAYTTTIKDSYNRGKIVLESVLGASKASASDPGHPSAGGIVGYSDTLTLQYTDVSAHAVVNAGEIVVTDNITSYTAESFTKIVCSVGGFVGYNFSGKTLISDFVYNTGSMTVTTNAHDINVGGIYGYVRDNSGLTHTGYSINKLRNNGDVTVYDTNIYSVNSSTEYCSKESAANGQRPLAIAAVGGVIGKYSTTKDSKIGLFSNTGKVIFDNQMSSRSISGVGGLVGIISVSSYSTTATYLEESYNMADVEVKVNSGETNIAIGIGGILGQHSVNVSNGSHVYINNTYNMGDIASSGYGRVMSGGIYGVSVLRNSAGADADTATGKYVLANDILANGETNTASFVSISNSYNIGSVTGSSSNMYGLGALMGYGIGATCTSKNYYLAGCASYPFATMSKTPQQNEMGETEIVETTTAVLDQVNAYEQKTTNTLKLYIPTSTVGISFTTYSTAWEQKVPTWYPTLKNNYETLLWDESYTPLSVQGQDYTIDSADQLAYLSYAVNNGILDTVGVQIKLTNNIDMANRYFTPIGNKTYPFKGTFNGDGYSINNITIDPNSALIIMDNGIAETVGSLFGYVDGGTIKNTGLISPIIKNVDFATGFVYSMTNTSHMEYCYTDNYEISDPDVVKDANVQVADRIKEGLISGKKDTSGFAHTINNSTINAGYLNVPLVADPVEDTSFKPKLAGFAVNSISSMVTNCYISEGAEGGREMFTYNTYNNTDSLFNKFVLNSVDVDGQNINSVEHSYNLGNGINNYIIKTFDSNEGKYVTNITDTLMSGIVDSGVDSYTLSQAGWDVIDIWSYEYSLLGDLSEDANRPATIRGLGQNWYNTECEDLILKNNAGKPITEKSATDSGMAQYYIYYEIRTAEELAWVARMINNGKIDSKDASGNLYVFKLMNDINLLGKYWTPIGTMDYPFSSKFDFNGYTISNLVIDCNDISFGGLFGYTQDAEIIGGFMDNVYINIDITSEEYNALTSVKGLYAGALIGKGNNTKVSNIEITGNVVGYSKYNAYVGGLAGNLTFAKSSTGGSSQDYKVDNVKVKLITGSEVLIPEDYRKNNGFGIDEIITEATQDDKLQVNIAGFSLTGNSYTGGILGYVAGKYTISYTTEAWVEKVFNETVVVSYAKSDISRSYCGGVVGYMTENTHLNIAQNNGDIKSATYGYDYIGGVAGMIAGGSEITNSVNKAEIECSQFASVISYSGGVAGYIRDGSTADKCANLGSSYKNVDSTKIFSAGAFGYVEKDVTGALPTVSNVVYTDVLGSYENPEATGPHDATIGYYGDGELIADDGSITVMYINTLADDAVKDIFVSPIWDASGNVSYSSVYEITFDSSVIVYVKTAPDANTYASTGSGAKIAMGTELVIQVTDTSLTHIIVNSRRYALTHTASGSGTITVSESGTPNCIVVKQLANGISQIRAESAS